MRKITLSLIAVCMCTNVSAADFAAGAKAYDGGRYAKAFAEWSALARQGERRAQVAVAGMYRFGEGRPVDLAKAAMWYARAAQAGDPIAQLNYAEMLENGQGVARDRAAARHWYIRAADQGNTWAAAQRDRLDAKLR
jgi:uncharacterized protein